MPARPLPLLILIVSIAHPLTAAEFSGDVTAVRTIRTVEQQSGAALLWEPYIAQWKPKHLVVAFGAGIPGKTDMGDILASVSTNDGDSWSEPACIFDHDQRFGALQFAYANPVLYHPPGEDIIWCYGMRCPMNYRHSEDSQLAAAYSADGGRSWIPVEMSMNYTGPLIIVAGIYRIEENGFPLYLLPAHRNTRRNDSLGSRDQLILSSTSLLEWNLRGHIPQPESGPVFMHEGGLAAGDHPGELKLMMRTAQYAGEGQALDPPRAYSSVSTDGGKSWTPGQPEPELWNSVSKSFFDRSQNGTQLYIYSDGPAWSRMALRYKIRPPQADWSEEKTFFDSGTKNSYPTLIEVAPGDYRAVWDSGTKDRMRTHIRFGKFKIASPGN